MRDSDKKPSDRAPQRRPTGQELLDALNLGIRQGAAGRAKVGYPERFLVPGDSHVVPSYDPESAGQGKWLSAEEFVAQHMGRAGRPAE